MASIDCYFTKGFFNVTSFELLLAVIIGLLKLNITSKGPQLQEVTNVLCRRDEPNNSDTNMKDLLLQNARVTSSSGILSSNREMIWVLRSSSNHDEGEWYQVLLTNE